MNQSRNFAVGRRGVGAVEPEQLAHHQVVVPEALELRARQGADEPVVHRERRVGQAAEDPQQHVGTIGRVLGAGGVGAGGMVGAAAHARVHATDARGHAVGLLARAEEDGLHELRRAREALERRVEALRLAHQPGERDRMGGLHQESALAVEQPDRAFLVHAPEH